jgi:phospholipase C
MKRRDFIRYGSASIGGTVAAGSVWAGLIEKALALPAHNPSGTPGLADIEHVIIFMQENRSFDHYLGSLPGVRGFGDPRPVPIPSGNTVWYQPEGTNPQSRSFSADIPTSAWTSPDQWYENNRATQSATYVLPFRLNQAGNVAFQYLTDLNHSWKQSQETWTNWDTWVPLKSRQSMGFLNAADLPFYHPLASAFTVCDDYHCSVFAATDPNRIYLWSGTCPPPMNFPDAYTTGGYVSDITHDDNAAITPAMYGQSAAARSAAVAAGVADWKTYAETLSDNRITWKVYQEYDNYGDNYLQYFKNFRVDNTGTPINESSDPYFQTLYQRGRVFAPQSANLGDALLAEFAKDVAAGMEPDDPRPATVKPGLPRVSWIVAPYQLCEHPSASPGDGESFTARLLNVLVNEYPAVFQKTAFLMMYDENDGYFDHVPSPIPPISAQYGQMTLADAGSAENMSAIPVGLGPRVPMLVISPWTRGGKVSSQLYDHTSVLRFLEQWLTAKKLATAEANRCALISQWRRAVCGDLTEVFDFGKQAPTTPIATHTTFINGVNPAGVPSPQAFPALPAPATRIGVALGHEFSVHGHVGLAGQFSLIFANTGSVGVAFIAYWMPMADAQASYQYTVEAGKSLTASPVPVGSDGHYDWAVYGPNGFLREFRGNVGRIHHSGQAPEVTTQDDVERRGIRLTLDNRNSPKTCVFHVSDNAYHQNKEVEVSVPGGSERTLEWAGSLDTSHPFICSGWYDVSVRLVGDADYFRRVAGCVQGQSRDLKTDPAIGNPAVFKPSFSIQVEADHTRRFDYVTPPWNHRPLNWLGVFPAGVAPKKGAELLRVPAPRSVGSTVAPITTLAVGKYDVWYLFDDGYSPLAGPEALRVTRGGWE